MTTQTGEEAVNALFRGQQLLDEMWALLSRRRQLRFWQVREYRRISKQMEAKQDEINECQLAFRTYMDEKRTELRSYYSL